MRLLLSTICICLFSFMSFAQEEEKTTEAITMDLTSEITDSRDRLILELNHTGFFNAPEALETKWFNRGANIYFTYDFPLGESEHFSFAPGVGFSFHNAYMNSRLVTDTIAGVPNFSYFEPIPESVDYSTSKFNTNYLEVPLELRYHTDTDNNGRSFKLAVGFRAARLLSAKTKYRGEQTNANGITEIVKIKELNSPNVFKYRYGPSFRIGYGEISLVAFYSMSGVFDENFGSQINPFSIGISFNSF